MLFEGPFDSDEASDAVAEIEERDDVAAAMAEVLRDFVQDSEEYAEEGCVWKPLWRSPAWSRPGFQGSPPTSRPFTGWIATPSPSPMICANWPPPRSRRPLVPISALG